LKKKYEQKLRLCEEAEALLIETRIIRATKNSICKRKMVSIGPVPNETKKKT
jgi:hypothetical protein